MPEQFDLIEALRRKELGLEMAAYGYGAAQWLAEARKVAEMLAAKQGEITSDDLLRVCPKPPHVSHQAIGSLFRTPRWRCIGRRPSAKISGHGREIRIWVLND